MYKWRSFSRHNLSPNYKTFWKIESSKMFIVRLLLVAVVVTIASAAQINDAKPGVDNSCICTNGDTGFLYPWYRKCPDGSVYCGPGNPGISNCCGYD